MAVFIGAFAVLIFLAGLRVANQYERFVLFHWVNFVPFAGRDFFGSFR